jgi:hypothetical protein
MFAELKSLREELSTIEYKLVTLSEKEGISFSKATKFLAEIIEEDCDQHIDRPLLTVTLAYPCNPFGEGGDLFP